MWSSTLVDEIGYLSYDARAADLLFQIVSRRYERRSLALTTNLSFSDWPSVFPNATTVTALIDRIVHHADIITIEGDSYRRREAKSDRNRPAMSPAADWAAGSKFRSSWCSPTTVRPHQILHNDSPRPRAVHPPALGSIVAIPLVASLHHRYQRAA